MCCRELCSLFGRLLGGLHPGALARCARRGGGRRAAASGGGCRVVQVGNRARACGDYDRSLLHSLYNVLQLFFYSVLSTCIVMESSDHVGSGAPSVAGRGSRYCLA